MGSTHDWGKTIYILPAAKQRGSSSVTNLHFAAGALRPASPGNALWKSSVIAATLCCAMLIGDGATESLSRLPSSLASSSDIWRR